VPSGANDQISSIRLYGNAEVSVFQSDNMRGQSRRFTSSISNLRSAGFDNLISSFEVERRESGNNWGGAYGGGSHGSNNDHGGSRYTYQQAEQIVQRAYRSTLGREMDPAGRPWINEVMKNNWTQSRLEAELRKSEEYLQKNRRP
jgi:hypothetical protein